MSLLSIAYQADMHRTAYRALLRGMLKEPGKKTWLAQQIGVSVQYLSYVLHDERVLSIALAERIAATLPMSHEERDQFLDHVHQATEQRLRMRQDVEANNRNESFNTNVEILRQTHSAANFARDSTQSKAQFHAVYIIGCSIMHQVQAQNNPLDMGELYLLLHDTASILNYQLDALYYAQLARSITESHNRNEIPLDNRDRWDETELNAIRAEAVAYHNLNLDHDAFVCCQQAEHTIAIKKEPALWIPHLYRDKINALCGKPRFAIREAEAYADTVLAWCERTTDPSAPLFACMIQRSLAHAYVQYGTAKKAYRLMRDPNEQLAHLQVVGPLHQTIVLSTAAHVRWAMGDTTESAFFIDAALNIATNAGLTHQTQKIQRTWGAHLSLTPSYAMI